MEITIEIDNLCVSCLENIYFDLYGRRARLFNKQELVRLVEYKLSRLKC